MSRLDVMVNAEKLIITYAVLSLMKREQIGGETNINFLCLEHEKLAESAQMLKTNPLVSNVCIRS